jgi:serine/threonine protein phosphatase PrpC
LTEDHSFSGALRRRGLLGHRSAVRHPYAQLATRQLGKGRDIIPAYRTEPLEPGDLLVALSDGMGELRGAARLTRWLDELCNTQGPQGPLFGGRLMEFLVDRFEARLAAVQSQCPDDATAMVVRPEAGTGAEWDTEDDSISLPSSDMPTSDGTAPAPPRRPRPATPPPHRGEHPSTNDTSGGSRAGGSSVHGR